jgi:hypothetical protein
MCIPIHSCVYLLVHIRRLGVGDISLTSFRTSCAGKRCNPLNAELNPICHLLVLLGDLTFMGPCVVSIFQYISNKMQRYTVFHPSSGAHTTVSTASGICHTVTAICRDRGRVGTGLSVLWVAYPTHSTLIFSFPFPTDINKPAQSACQTWRLSLLSF